MRSSVMAIAILAACALWLGAPSAASAKGKGKMKSCATAEATFRATGEGDRDGDGLSDCRESKQLHTSPDLADSDGDGLSDGEEVADHCDPLDADSDHDGVEDGNDSDPGIPEQEVKAFLDALTCPQVGVPGSLTVLGIAVTLDDHTEFEDATCAEIATLLAMPGSSVFVEVSVLEDSAGALTAAEVELEHGDDQGDDDQGEDEGGDED
jgi:Domain of unknown function (DUF5666)/Bacterial TSP3 repeat